MKTFPKQLPARVLKRIRQVRRLGARGFARTAYVTSVAGAVYALTDGPRHLAYVMHRQRMLRSQSPVLRDMAAAAASVSGMRFSELDSTQRTGELLTALEEALLRIHEAGYALGEVDESAVLFTDSGPVIVDFTHAMPLAGLGRDMSIHARDFDRRRFNRLFGTNLLTAERLRRTGVGRHRDDAPSPFRSSAVYAPVAIRDDIHWGNLWNTDVGVGRWNFIMREHLPIPAGGSVLDLGSNNGFNPLQMLRSGAASAIGVEIDGGAVREAEFLKKAYEWVDNRSYDFRCIHGSQAHVHRFGFERFDIVTALCSLYYLPEEEMVRTMRYLRSLTDMLVLQCNTDRLIERGNEETYRKASVEFALEALRAAGFPSHEVIAPPGYSRPLVIGRG